MCGDRGKQEEKGEGGRDRLRNKKVGKVKVVFYSRYKLEKPILFYDTKHDISFY